MSIFLLAQLLWLNNYSVKNGVVTNIIQLSNFLIACIILQISYYLLKNRGAGAKHCAKLF